MLLNENNYKEQIHAFTQQDWKPLIELIPKVESTSKFGGWAGGKKDEKETIFLYYNTLSAGTGFSTGAKSDELFQVTIAKTGRLRLILIMQHCAKVINFTIF
jgi:hypothetical protein